MHPCTLKAGRTAAHCSPGRVSVQDQGGLLSQTPAPDFMLSDASVSNSCTCYRDDDFYAFAEMVPLSFPSILHYHFFNGLS